LFWQGVLRDRFILFLDMPFAILLTLILLVSVLRSRVNRTLGVALLCIYVAWVLAHLWV
jgi:Ca2+/Na+ antiporter